ncbi:helix-turn-helix domain-containing protein [Variovorax ginsengisoli]|uniref:Transcriptional regulator of acetoin/glycerol metabolism n=1 Tax=Variovorax ginsengisoli TaxID=363844 RepID=A0ABT9SE13_9BURK|nr:helix-turn-helix domain-containing protein [Variovorax ginsengisoli]MDP9901981.1 transcriptional regulator of acetoin/glycerol metabolism [Variovorax ginsengisoli]
MASRSTDTATAPRALFASTPAERTALARQQFFEDGVRPSGLVPEAVLQSWMRCTRTHADRHRVVPFDPVTPSRLHATRQRHRALIEAADPDLSAMEGMLAGTDCRVILTDCDGVVLHVTHHPHAAHQPVLSATSRVGVNISERMVGTTAPGIVASTGQACTVDGAEHYFDQLCGLQCAAAPIRDVHGRLAGVLDLTVEQRRFGFDAAAMVGLYATTIENRLLQAQSRSLLVLRFQAHPSLLGTPMEALMGIASDGTIAWLNGAAVRLVGPLPEAADAADATDAAGQRHVGALLGCDLGDLLQLGRHDTARPLRLPHGLAVWMRARLNAPDGADFRHAVATVAPADTVVAAPMPQAAVAMTRDEGNKGEDRGEGACAPAVTTETLRAHSHRLIEDTLAAHGGNISHAARQLGVSRGTLYRQLRRWRQQAGPDNEGESESAPAG